MLIYHFVVHKFHYSKAKVAKPKKIINFVVPKTYRKNFISHETR